MITKYSNFLEEDFYQECLKYSKDVLKNRKNIYKHTDICEVPMTSEIPPILIHKIEPNNKELSDKISSVIRNKLLLTDCEVVPNIYYFTPGSQIAWHNDEHLHATVTHYLNENWDINNGGLFLYSENDEIKGIKPERNLAVFQTDATPHAVTTLAPNSPFRVAIHSFVMK